MDDRRTAHAFEENALKGRNEKQEARDANLGRAQNTDRSKLSSLSFEFSKE